MQSAGDEGQRPPPSTPDATHGDPRPASGSPPDEPQHAPQASRSAGPETRGGLRRRTNEGAAADAPSSKKRRKANPQVDSAGFTTRQSNRDRRPTRRAAEM